uniref:LAGLIDADG homing endonuclease n=1 Tax=Porodaedalea pini TaxID=108901 RepID=A0A5B9RJP6_9AGAM|nr:LAGLIDADG homing endonuclease [Porodaedalea pini]QEG56985.1 LAGLIDADG homing endonuclease [Porodaedalea pini]
MPNPNWIAGFSSAEGCFLVSIYPPPAGLRHSNKNKISQFVQLIFKISQHHRDKNLLELIAKYLNCGQVIYHSEKAKVFLVGKFVDINNKILLIFKAHSIQGIKQLDYQDFCEIATLIGDPHPPLGRGWVGKHLSPIGIAKIQLIKDRMNTKRK